MQIVKRFTAACPLKALLNTLVLLIGLGVESPPADAAPNQPVTPPCSELNGTFVFTLFQFTSPTTAIGEGIVYNGDAAVGTFDAQYFNIEIKGNTEHGNGVIQMNGQHTIVFADGILMTHDEILLEPVKTKPGWLRANSRLYLVGGAGAYAGATGLLHTHGEANVFTDPPQGSIDFDGQVCVP
jgi:hypothetical protein